MTATLVVPANAPRDAPRILLTQGLFAIVDPTDVRMLIRYKWHAHKTFHSTGTFWYARGWVDGRRQFMHTLLTGLARVDHINGNGLDNRRVNLRPASQRQNSGNRRKVTAGSSRFKGVSWQKSVSRWKAQIRAHGRHTYLGLYDSEEAAALAYDEAARSQFGEFAAVNFPRAGERSALSRGES